MKTAKLMIAGFIFTLSATAYATPKCNHQASSSRFSNTVVKVASATGTSSAVSTKAVK